MRRDGSMLFIGMDGILGWEAIGMARLFWVMGGSDAESGLERLSAKRSTPPGKLVYNRNDVLTV